MEELYTMQQNNSMYAAGQYSNVHYGLEERVETANGTLDTDTGLTHVGSVASDVLADIAQKYLARHSLHPSETPILDALALSTSRPNEERA
jgi:hypothetical protein